MKTFDRMLFSLNLRLPSPELKFRLKIDLSSNNTLYILDGTLIMYDF